MRKFTGLASILALLTLVSVCPSDGKESETADLFECMAPSVCETHAKNRPPSYDEKRAYAFMKMGKLDEAIHWFEKTRLKDYGGEWEEYGSQIDLALGEAHEKLGKYDEAARYYIKSEKHESARPRAALYLKMNRFYEALEICNKQIDKLLKNGISYFNSRYSKEYADWLQLSATAKAGMHENKEAVADFKKAALLYSEDNSEKLNECLSAANKIIERTPQENALVIRPSDLPRKGQDVIFELFDYLIAAEKSPDLKTINKLLGTKLRLPGRESQLVVSPALLRVDLHSSDKENYDLALLKIDVWRDNCAIDKLSVTNFLPAPAYKAGPVYGFFDGEKLENAESWKLPSGTLVLYFARSGFQVLEKIEWRPNTAKMPTYGDFLPGMEWEIEKAIKMNNPALAYELAEKALKLPDEKKVFDAKDQILSRIYQNRIKLYLRDGKTDLAMADLKALSDLKAFRQFPEIINLFIENEKLKEAIEVTKYAASQSGFKREKTLLNLILARLLLQDKQYAEAFKLSTECIESESEPNSGMEKHSKDEYFHFEKYESMTAQAHLIRAKAEFGMGQRSDAYRDGETAANLLFDLARVECSFRIREWIKTI